MLSDNYQRLVSYLRISVTERCNFRCTYCAAVPAGGERSAAKSEFLSFEEIERVARVAARMGLSKIRLTGGEPTVRRDLPTLVRKLSSIKGVREIAMTTNASMLAQLAWPLKDAGLDRLNISLDSIKRERFNRIARRDCFEVVMKGIAEAVRVGYENLKFNCVVVRGDNDDELCDLADFAAESGGVMRFIEFMPMGALAAARTKTVAMAEMLARLNKKFDLRPADDERQTKDPARNFVCLKSGVRVGFIASVSNHFCDSCNRMRLTATGGLRPCLHQNAEVDVRGVLRGGGSDADVADAFRRAAALKWAGHRMNAFVPLYSRKEMIAIGG